MITALLLALAPVLPSAEEAVSPTNRAAATAHLIPYPREVSWGAGSLALGSAELAPGETPALFPAPEVPAVALPRLPDLDAYARGRLEFELLGLSLRVHPTRLFGARTPPPEHARRGAPLTPCARVHQLAGGRVTVHGWLAATRRMHTKDGKWMRFLTLEDESGVAEGVLFPPSYERWGHLLTHRGPFYVTGVVQEQLGACTIDVQRID